MAALLTAIPATNCMPLHVLGQSHQQNIVQTVCRGTSRWKMGQQQPLLHGKQLHCQLHTVFKMETHMQPVLGNKYPLPPRVRAANQQIRQLPDVACTLHSLPCKRVAILCMVTSFHATDMSCNLASLCSHL
jgi:hypothetical protein